MGSSKGNSSIYCFTSVVIILLGFALRVHTLAQRSLWFDESIEYWVATSPLSELSPTVKTALQDPPLYSLLLHFWLEVGRNEFGLRFLSLIFSVTGILGVMVLSRVSFGKEASLVGGLLVAVSVPDIRFAQEVGQYALMLFVLSWNLVFLFLSMRKDTWKWSILWGVSGAIAVYSYYGAALTIGATTLVCLVYTVAKQQWSRLLKLVIVGGVCSVLVLPLALEWLPKQMLRGPTATAFQFSVGSYQEEIQRFVAHTKAFLMFQFVGYQPNGWPWPRLPEWTIWLPAVSLLSVSVIRFKFHLPIMWFMAGLLIYHFAGRLGIYPSWGRYFLILSPLFWTCLAAGIVGLLSLRNTLAMSFVGLIVLVGFLSPVEPQEDLRSVTELWLSLRQPSEVTYVYYGAVPGFRYQLSLAGVSETVPSLWYYRCWQGEAISYCSHDGIFYGRWIRSLSSEQKKESVLETIGGSPDRLWMIFSHTYPEEDVVILAAFEDTYRIAVSYYTENGAAFLLEMR